MIDGKRLKELRQKRGLTAEQLALLVGVARQQIVRYESGGVGMNTETLTNLADVFDVSADYLLGRTESPRPYERKEPLIWHINTTNLLNNFHPKTVAQVVKAFGIKIEPEVLEVNVTELLQQFPPAYVATFLKELGSKVKLTGYPPDSDE